MSSHALGSGTRLPGVSGRAPRVPGSTAPDPQCLSGSARSVASLRHVPADGAWPTSDRVTLPGPSKVALPVPSDYAAPYQGSNGPGFNLVIVLDQRSDPA